MTKRIVFDPGHGGSNHGAKANGIVEKDLTLLICQRASSKANGLGLPHILTRTDDVDRSQLARGRRTTKDDLVISLHHDAHRNPEEHGVTCYYWPGNQEGFLVSAMLLDGIYSTVKEVKEGRLDIDGDGVVEEHEKHMRNVRAILMAHAGTTVLLEAFFLTNYDDAQYLKTEEGRDDIATAMVDAAWRWYHGDL